MEHDGLRVAGLRIAQAPGRCSHGLLATGWDKERLTVFEKPPDRLLDHQPLRSRARP
jgi:hypothetical protein